MTNKTNVDKAMCATRMLNECNSEFPPNNVAKNSQYGNNNCQQMKLYVV